jgi:hypothetical protein
MPYLLLDLKQLYFRLINIYLINNFGVQIPKIPNISIWIDYKLSHFIDKYNNHIFVILYFPTKSNDDKIPRVTRLLTNTIYGMDISLPRSQLIITIPWKKIYYFDISNIININYNYGYNMYSFSYIRISG